MATVSAIHLQYLWRWAGNCDLNTSHIQKGIEGYGTYIFKPVTLSGTLALREGTFTNDDWLFVCQSLQNVVITLTGEAQHSTEYNFWWATKNIKLNSTCRRIIFPAPI